MKKNSQEEIKQKLIHSLGMAQKFQKNIIDNPTEEKYRQVKPNNEKIKDALTKYYNGLSLLKVIGFQEFYDPQSRESVLKLPINIS